MTALTMLRAPLWTAAVAGLALGGLAGVRQVAQTPHADGTTATAVVLAQEASEDSSPLDPQAPGETVEGDTLLDAVLEIDANDVFLRRDPFDPVVSSQFATDTGSGDGTVDGDTTTDDSTDTGAGTTGDGTTGGGTTGGGTTTDRLCVVSDSEAVCDGTVIALTDVDEDGTVTVSVAGTRVRAKEGDVLAGGDVLVGPAAPPCAAFGYRLEVLQLCVGSLK